MSKKSKPGDGTQGNGVKGGNLYASLRPVRIAGALGRLHSVAVAARTASR
ncbi:hypothetical protein [Kribbella antibiotica]|nr:hypothetical protein [Kribbella antibiotica]